VNKPIIFLGPSMTLEEARLFLDADFRPPAQRGDLPDAISESPPLVGIVDGQFYQALPVSPGEVVAALRTGIPILGASSMGALRAAELWSYGMIGVGQIFEWYRDEVIEADDEVALTYDPETLRQLSEPLVNMRYAFRRAVEDQIIDAPTEMQLIEATRALFFPERTYPRVVKEAALSPAAQAALLAYLAEKQYDLKRDDARLLLIEAACQLATAGTPAR
jgi:hypothetical protein